MRMVYWDTSLLIKLYVEEVGSEATVAATNGVDRIFTSVIAQAEFPSAFHRKVREGEWTSREVKAVLQQVDLDVSSGVLSFISLTTEVWKRVRLFYEEAGASTYLRAPDAIHLASCETAGFKEVYAHDRHLLAAAVKFGLRGLDPISTS